MQKNVLEDQCLDYECGEISNCKWELAIQFYTNQVKGHKLNDQFKTICTPLWVNIIVTLVKTQKKQGKKTKAKQNFPVCLHGGFFSFIIIYYFILNDRLIIALSSNRKQPSYIKWQSLRYQNHNVPTPVQKLANQSPQGNH